MSSIREIQQGSYSDVLPNRKKIRISNNFDDLQRQRTSATSWEELTHWKRLWCWEGLGAGGKGDDRRWDGWMASLTRWTWVWVNSESWWWTGRPGVLQFMGSQRVGHDWVTELDRKTKKNMKNIEHIAFTLFLPLTEGLWAFRSSTTIS